MEKVEKRTARAKKQVAKFKEAGIRPWRMIGSIVLFVGAFFLFPYLAGLFENPLNVLAIVYLFFQAVAVGVDVLQGHVPFKIGPVLLVFSRYVFGTFLELLFILLILPLILLDMIMGPFMFIAFALSGLGLGIYFIENIIGHDIKGVVSFDNGTQALIAVPIFIISFFVMLQYSRVLKFIDWVVDKIKDFLVYLESGKKPTKKELP